MSFWLYCASHQPETMCIAEIFNVDRPTEMYNYQAEFMAYLDEVKGMNSEEMSNGMMKAEFRSFVEDFNTATMVRLPFTSSSLRLPFTDQVGAART